ncbi:hypothetical protein [Rhodococcus sp. Q]|uniref:hypothetical protein n=1 Tax=Rhodococcus sp. Q TaxID=2502252 RepID=UPI0020169BA9|nr:hypothetical protein [Rhodococcus sp. Q]
MNAARAEEWMRGYIAESLSQADLETFIDDVAKSMGANVPELSTDADVQRDLQLAVRSQFRAILAVTKSGTAPLWSGSGSQRSALTGPDDCSAGT